MPAFSADSWASCYSAAAGQAQSSYEQSIHLSIHKTHELWQNKRNFCPQSYTICKVNAYHLATKKVLVGASPSTWKFGPYWPTSFEHGDFQFMFALSTSAVTPSERISIITNRKSTTRFPVSLKMNTAVTVHSPQVGPKMHSGRFSYTSSFLSKRAATKSLCVKMLRSKVIWHSLAYLTMHKWLVGDIHLNVNFVHKVNHTLVPQPCDLTWTFRDLSRWLFTLTMQQYYTSAMRLPLQTVLITNLVSAVTSAMMPLFLVSTTSSATTEITRSHSAVQCYSRSVILVTTASPYVTS